MLDKTALGLAIRMARMKKGYTQEQLAEITEITPTHEKNIESGHRSPSVDVLFRIVKALDLSLDNYLFPAQNTGNERLREINILLSQCEEKELNVTKALVASLIENR